ncbi:MAG: DNA polymerase III subunit delta [Propionibacteriaceae bacterium]|jgi:DNA polymerase-3 subunit delta|nr:DNA polymerase III subunit delta [Propionibacteriaceae bacterium]
MSAFGTTLLVVGTDELLVRRRVDERVRAALAEIPGAEVTELSAADLASGRFSEVIGGSLFAPAAVVIVRDYAMLAAEQLDEVLHTVAAPGDALCLILVHRGEVGKALIGRAEAAGAERAQVEVPKAWQLPEFVVSEAGRLGVQMDTAAARALVEAVGTKLTELSAAVSQLASDWEGARLTAEMVGRYYTGQAGVRGFAVADAVMAGQTDVALTKLRWALERGATGGEIVSAIASGLRSLGRFMELRGSQLPQREVAVRVGVPEWKLRTLAQQARTWSPRGVAAALRVASQADAAVKGAAVDKGFALEKALLDIDYAREIY